MDSLVDELATGDALLAPPWGEMGRSTTLGVVSLFSKCVLRVLNTFSIEGAEEFHRHVMERPEGVGLITVCNHTRWGVRGAAGRHARPACRPHAALAHAVTPPSLCPPSTVALWTTPSC